jgi:hypothetical protein
MAEKHLEAGTWNGPAPTWWGCVPHEDETFLCIFSLPEGTSAETFPDPDVTTAERSIPGTVGFRRDRGPVVIIVEHGGAACTFGNENPLCSKAGSKFLSCQPGDNGQDCAHRL